MSYLPKIYFQRHNFVLLFLNLVSKYLGPSLLTLMIGVSVKCNNSINVIVILFSIFILCYNKHSIKNFLWSCHSRKFFQTKMNFYSFSSKFFLLKFVPRTIITIFHRVKVSKVSALKVYRRCAVYYFALFFAWKTSWITAYRMCKYQFHANLLWKFI